jgi:CheY-like chemotaxis protein
MSFDFISILIVDDQEQVRDSMKQIVSRISKDLGFNQIQIMEGYDGNCMVDLIITLKADIDIIFTDESMAFMNGSEAIEKIRLFELKEKRDYQIPIFSVTSENSEICEKITKAGANQVLQKPLNKTEVRRIFQEYIKTTAPSIL